MMCRRWLGGIVAVFTALGAALHGFSQTRPESPRQAAWRLAQDAIRDGGPRPGIPDFVNWLPAREIYPCEGGSAKSVQPPALRNLFDESLHYNPKAAARLC